MVDTFRPETEDQILEAVKWVAAEKKPLEVLGGGTKRPYGRPLQTAVTLDMSAMTGIEIYEPAELYVTAKAGTPMEELEKALAEAGQHLAFEPPNLGPLLGTSNMDDLRADTIGGVIATNLGGPRRIKEGAARDHVLGFHAVSGRGEVFKSGGTVVKNVTGFDLSKLMAGSFGTLAVLSTVTLKTLPKPEKIRTVLIRWKTDGLYERAAMKAMSDALGSPHDVSGAAHLPARVAARSVVDRVSQGGAVTALRIEGPAPSVEHRTAALSELLRPFGEIDELHTTNSTNFWQEVRDVGAFVGRDDLPVVWRLSVPPMSGANVAQSIFAQRPGEAFFDWGGGLVWLATASDQDGGADVVRDAVLTTGGHATLVRAPAALRDAIPVFQPLSGGEAMVSEKIKSGFDPHGVLNPGRMYAGV